MAEQVLVTGCTGFIATELVKQLLIKGYDVRGTVRSLADESKVAHLKKLADALPGTLKLFEADLLQEGSFDDAVAGAKYVFHTASPFFIKADDPQKELVDPALKGTRNVLNSVVRHKDTVQRVVLTASVAAVFGRDRKPPKNGGSTYSEEDWNDTSTIETQAYHVSKTLAEQEAWKIAKENGLDLVTILPNFVMGPLVSNRTSGTSVSFYKGILEGGPIGSSTIFADVRDVASAHVLAAEVPSAAGRYIVSQTTQSTPKWISDLLQKRFPELNIQSGEEAEAKTDIDNSKAQRELGLSITPVEQSLVDMAVTMLQLGIVDTKKTN